MTMMKKVFMGIRLKMLREERGLTQIALAQALGLSPSYLNQLENNQRPLTVPVLLKLNSVFGLDVQLFSESDDAKLMTDLREFFDSQAGHNQISHAEIRELATNMPAVSKTLLTLATNYRALQEKQEALLAQFGVDRNPISSARPMPFEEVRDFFYARHNYVHELDVLAEDLSREWSIPAGESVNSLTTLLAEKFGIKVIRRKKREAGADVRRHYDEAQGVLNLSPYLSDGQASFQMATQIGLLYANAEIKELIEHPDLTSREAKRLARIGLANYFASALILPYGHFLEAAERLKYDIELLGQEFGVEFETVCHRLSTLQRPEARGVPFFFVRVDRAGNISKRQSATDFHFSRIGGTCPLWNVYEAFTQPGRILTQLAEMPDGRSYLWVTRTVTRGYGGYGAPHKIFSIGLGCDIHHADRLVYSKGLNIKDRDGFTPIGSGCKVCPRQQCPQRAFPVMGSTLIVDENKSQFSPYPFEG